MINYTKYAAHITAAVVLVASSFNLAHARGHTGGEATHNQQEELLLIHITDFGNSSYYYVENNGMSFTDTKHVATEIALPGSGPSVSQYLASFNSEPEHYVVGQALSGLGSQYFSSLCPEEYSIITGGEGLSTRGFPFGNGGPIQWADGTRSGYRAAYRMFEGYQTPFLGQYAGFYFTNEGGPQSLQMTRLNQTSASEEACGFIVEIEAIADTDVDGDGIADSIDPDITDGPLADHDADGQINRDDDDDDNDGLSDETEVLLGTNPYDVNSGVIADFGPAVIGLLSQANSANDKNLSKAQAKLEDAFAESNWVDGNHLVVKDGKKVFNDIESAVKKLEHIVSNKDSSSALSDTANTAIDLLLRASLLIVDRLYHELEALEPTDDKDLKTQNRALDKAAEDISDAQSMQAAATQKAHKAVTKYESAWKALDKGLRKVQFRSE